MTARFVDVAPLSPIPDVLTYELSPEWLGSVMPGMRVLIPLAKRLVTGCVVALHNTPSIGTAKFIADVLDDQPTLTPELLQLTRWMATYYVASWGETLRTALPRALQTASVQVARLTSEGRQALLDSTLPPIDSRILALLGQHRRLTLKQLQHQLATTGGRSAVHRLTAAGLVEVSQQVTPSRLQGPTEAIFELGLPPAEVKATVQTLERRAPQQAAVLRHLLHTGACSAAELRRSVPSSSHVLRALEQKGLLRRGQRQRASILAWRSEEAFLGAADITLNAAQSTALERIGKLLHDGQFAPILLHGVTGSGKTEIYLRAIATTLAQGKQVIYLVPEIALTPQLLARIHARFGQAVAVLHSRLTRGERLDEWSRVYTQQASIALGPRSAVFAPLQRVGLIIVDEEHDPSYKQEEAPRYLARDVAIMRAKLSQAVVILGSATPSLESFANAQQQRYHYLQLPERVRTQDLPQVAIVDLRREEHRPQPGDILSYPLRHAMAARLARREQTLLFLNRRGYATFVQCHDCGFICQCSHCSVTLTFHLADRTLKCHYCQFTSPPPETCPTCHGTRLEYFGTGTQKVEREVRRLFPGARVSRMDRDVTGGRYAFQDILERLARGDIDILIGTQMITKGHDFPGITLVGVVSADVALGVPDFRAAERTFQLLTQVAGRAGRGEVAGEVIIQTHAPHHYAIRRAQMHDFLGFYAEEIGYRRRLGYPPALRLAALRFEARDPQAVEHFCHAFVGLLRPYVQQAEGVTILGPAPAVLAKLKNRYRWHLLIKAPTTRRLHEVIAQGLRALKQEAIPRHGVRLAIDIDPLNLL